MAFAIALEKIPSQQFAITLGGFNYDIRIFSVDFAMYYDVVINGEVVISGFEIINDELFLPWEYQERSGNLVMVIPEDEVADFNSFGTSQFLAYLTADETRAYRDRSEN